MKEVSSSDDEAEASEKKGIRRPNRQRVKSGEFHPVFFPSHQTFSKYCCCVCSRHQLFTPENEILAPGPFICMVGDVM